MHTIALQHNLATYEQAKSFIDKGEDCCIVNPCGSGKSSVISELINNYANKNIIVITKQGNAENYYRKTCPVFDKNHIRVYTYNALYNLYKNNMLESLSDTDITIFDEAHYVGAKKWSKAVSALKTISSCISVGVTATPQRYEDQGSDKTITKEFDDNIAGNYSTKYLQKTGVFIEPDYYVSLASLENEINAKINQINDSDLDDKIKTKYIEKLQAVHNEWLENDCPQKLIPNILPKYMYKPSGNKIVVFCKNTETISSDVEYIMPILHKTFPGKKIKAYCYSYKSGEKEFQKFLTDNSNYINVLFSINKICETVHISDLNVLFFLRSAVSHRIITQQIGRINDINNPNKGLIIDMVDNLSNYKTNSKSKEPYGEHDNESSTSHNISINMNYIKHCIDIFDEIDRVAKKSKTYSYHTITGSINQLCYVFRKHESKVKQHMADGYAFEDAMDFDDTNKKYTTYKSREHIHKTLSEDSKALIKQYYPAIQEIMISKNCHDEDIAANLAVDLCEIVQTYLDTQSTTYPNTYIKTFLLNKLLYYLRSSNDYSTYETLYDTVPEVIDSESVESITDCKELQRLLTNARNTLTNREQQVINIRFGFGCRMHTLEETAKFMNVTSTRIRQIEVKALRKLRHPNRSRDMKPFLEDTYK